MIERVAAKGLITCEDGKYLCVAGRRGMWNLVGGGVKPGETPKMAFLREAGEEIENLPAYIAISDSVEPFKVSGPTTSRTGIDNLTHWLVFQAELQVQYTELKIARPREISAIGAFTRQEFIEHPNMSDLAKQVINLVIV